MHEACVSSSLSILDVYLSTLDVYLSILRSAPGQRPVISEAEMSEQLLQAVSRIVHKTPEMNQSTGAAAEHHLQRAIRMVRFSRI